MLCNSQTNISKMRKYIVMMCSTVVYLKKKKKRFRQLHAGVVNVRKDKSDCSSEDGVYYSVPLLMCLKHVNFSAHDSSVLHFPAFSHC